MYAYIRYSGDGNSINSVLSDVSAVITGETNLNNLSSSVVVDDSILTSSISGGGWTLHDDVSDTEKVFSSPISSDPSQTKYLHLSVWSGHLVMESYRSWDAETHTGVVNKRKPPDETTSATTMYNILYRSQYLTGEASVMISSSDKHFAGCSQGNNLGAVWGLCLLTEHTRMSAWDTVENGYLPIVYTHQSLSYDSFATSDPRHKDWFCKPVMPVDESTDADINSYNVAGINCASLLTSFGCSFATSYTTTSATSIPAAIKIPEYDLTSDLTQVRTVVSMQACNGAVDAQFVGDLSSMNGIYLTYVSSGSPNDYIEADGRRYRLWMRPNTNSWNATPAIGLAFLIQEG